MATDDLFGGLWIPKDGVADPTLICDTLIEEAVRLGVRVVESCAVTQVSQDGGRVAGVNTTKGYTKCDYFVNCGGFWARNIGQLSKPCVKVPLHAVEHYYLYTKPIEGLDPMTPVVRDLDGQIYIKESKGRILGGGFELKAKPAFVDGSIPCKTSLNATTNYYHNGNMIRFFCSFRSVNKYSKSTCRLGSFSSNVRGIDPASSIAGRYKSGTSNKWARSIFTRLQMDFRRESRGKHFLGLFLEFLFN